MKEETVRKKNMQACEEVGVAKHFVFPMVCGSGGSKSRLAKAASAKLSNRFTPDEKWKIARQRGAKHMSKSKCTKHFSLRTN